MTKRISVAIVMAFLVAAMSISAASASVNWNGQPEPDTITWQG